MTKPTLQQAYDRIVRSTFDGTFPSVVSLAVFYNEGLDPASWHVVRLAASIVGFAFIVDRMKNTTLEGLSQNKFKNLGLFQTALGEFDTEDFKRYLRAKLGMM